MNVNRKRAALWDVLARAVSECRECDGSPHDCPECTRTLERYTAEILVGFATPLTAPLDELADLETDDELVTLHEAVDRRLVLASVTCTSALVVLRRAQRRDRGFPAAYAERDRAWLYRVGDLRRWEVGR